MKAGICPWCGANVAPVENTDSKGERDPRWRARNPLQCPECREAGGYDDWYGDEMGMVSTGDNHGR